MGEIPDADVDADADGDDHKDEDVAGEDGRILDAEEDDVSEDAFNGDADREARGRAGEYGEARSGAARDEEALADDTYGLADADERSASAGVEGGSEADDTYGVDEVDRQDHRGGRGRPGE